jgi:hypothetical protein
VAVAAEIDAAMFERAFLAKAFTLGKINAWHLGFLSWDQFRCFGMG